MCNYADIEEIKNDLFSGYIPGWNHLLSDEIFEKLTREIMIRHSICRSADQFLRVHESQAYPEFRERYKNRIGRELQPIDDNEEDIQFWTNLAQ